MTDFELRDRDGLARLGRLSTPHGAIETPALLPVVHPDPSRQPVVPRELRRRFGLAAVITSSYITWRTPALRARAEEAGIHGLLDFDGPVMTDSGAFQQHAYGHVEVGDEEIFSFQRRIGSDIPTVLDEFVEPDAGPEDASAGVDATSERARRARRMHTGLLAVPVQGGSFPELRARSAREASEVGDVLAVGGVVPLLEQYRFPELARALLAARPHLDPGKVVHLFGTGHPMTFAFAALFGVDLFDSSSYHKFARRGRLLFPEGTVAVDAIREGICRCVLCADVPLAELKGRPAAERERRIAEHNLLVCAEEVARVRQAIRDGNLWELAERRAASHPALQAGLRAAVRGARVFLTAEPESRRSFRVVGATSGLRPSVIRFLARLSSFRAGRPAFRPHPWVPLSPEYLSGTPTQTRSGEPLHWECATPIGPVPVELTELYPIGCYVGVEEYEAGPRVEHRWTEELRAGLELGSLDVDAAMDWGPAWTRRQARSLLEWRYGPPAADALWGASSSGYRSRRTARLRAILEGGVPMFVIGDDGLPRPTWKGAQRLHAVLPFPASRIIVHPDAVPFVEEGRSLFSRFVTGGDASLVPGQSALLVDPDDRLLASGRLVLAPGEMGHVARAVAVRVTAHARAPPAELPAEGRAPDGPPAPGSDDL